MERIDLHDAASDLPSLVERATAGEEIVIAKGDKAVARLSPLPPQPQRRKPAGALGVRHIAADFDAPEDWG